MIKVDIIKALNEFHAHERLSKGTIACFITLIPKKRESVRLGRFLTYLLYWLCIQYFSKDLDIEVEEGYGRHHR